MESSWIPADFKLSFTLGTLSLKDWGTCQGHETESKFELSSVGITMWVFTQHCCNCLCDLTSIDRAVACSLAGEPLVLREDACLGQPIRRQRQALLGISFCLPMKPQMMPDSRKLLLLEGKKSVRKAVWWAYCRKPRGQGLKSSPCLTKESCLICIVVVILFVGN